MSPASLYGRGRRRVAWTTAKSAVGAAMPTARAPMAAAKNDGCLRRERTARIRAFMAGPGQLYGRERRETADARRSNPLLTFRISVNTRASQPGRSELIRPLAAGKTRHESCTMRVRENERCHRPPKAQWPF